MGLMRFIHTADWHLGMPGGFLGPEARPRYAEARIDAVRAIAALASEVGAAFVLACGDVFDSNHVDRQVVARAADAMSAFEVPLLILPGNHDPLDAASVYRSTAFTAAMPECVTVIEGPDPIAIGGIEVVGAPWHARRPGHDPSGAVLDDLIAGPVRVLAAHGVVDLLSPDATDPTLIRMDGLRSALDDGRLAYVALGDRHSATQVDGDARVRYPGTPVATDHGELDPGQVLVVTLGDGLAVEQRPIGDWAFVRLEVRLDGGADVEALDSALAELPDKARTVVRLYLTGTLSVADDARLWAMLDEQRELFAALAVSERGSDLAVMADDTDLGALGLSGYALAAAEDIAALASAEGEEQQAARDALRLLYRLTRAGA